MEGENEGEKLLDNQRGCDVYGDLSTKIKENSSSSLLVNDFLCLDLNIFQCYLFCVFSPRLPSLPLNSFIHFNAIVLNGFL